MLAMTLMGNIHQPALTGIISTFLNSRDCAVLVVSCPQLHHSTPNTITQKTQRLMERPSLSSCFPSRQIAQLVDSLCLLRIVNPIRTTRRKTQRQFVQVLSTTVFKMRASCFLPLKVSLRKLLASRTGCIH